MKKVFVILALIGFGIGAFALNYYGNVSNNKTTEMVEEQNNQCRACFGVGYFVCEKYVTKTCSSCKGKGYIEVYQQGSYVKKTCNGPCKGNGTYQEPCPKCGSSGKRMCKACNGTGKN